MTKAITLKATRSVAVSRIISAPCIAIQCNPVSHQECATDESAAD
jgi:hypothetical protein